MKWTMTNRESRPVPPRADRYYNVMGPGGKLRAAYPVMSHDDDGDYVQFWETNTGSRGLMWPGDVIAFSEPIELSEELIQTVKESCRLEFISKNYCEERTDNT